ncbi:MAG: carboxymuconolactone decarboxylase family protein [Bacteroidota bacterium]
MSNFIQVPTRDQVDAKAQGIFDNLQKQLGTVPNLYAVIGHSGDALANFLTFSSQAGGNSFTKKEREAIDLAVSEVNGCTYCLAAHTALSKMAGFTEAEIIELRARTIADPRLRAITQLAANITENRGKADDQYVQAFFDQGFNEKALIDLLAAVTAITFTNYAHGLTKVAVDFPQAPALADLATA